MGEYFSTRQEAEDAIRKWGSDVQMFVHIRDGDNERWMVDFKRRPILGSIQLLEDLTGQLSTIIGTRK